MELPPELDPLLGQPVAGGDPLKDPMKMVGTLGILPAYREIFRPAFKPSESERDYAELLMRLFVDSVDYEGLFGKDEGLRAFAETYPPYRRTIARGCWIMATGFRGGILRL